MSSQQHSTASSTTANLPKTTRLRSISDLLGEVLLPTSERAALKKFYTKYASTAKAKPKSTQSPDVTTAQAAKPTALPQIAPWTTAPIIRAYAPWLATHDVPAPLFLRIIDAYNLAISASPSMQALDAAGGILGLVPEPHVQIASQIIGGVAAAGEEELSRARGGVLVRRVNREILEARGLRMDVVKGKHLGAVLGMAKEETLPVMPPMSEVEMEMEVGEGDEVPGAASTNAERRVRALGNLIAVMTFEVPAPEEQTKKMHKYLAGEQKKEFEEYREKQREKRERRMKEKKERNAKMAEKEAEVDTRMKECDEERQRLEAERDQQIAALAVKVGEKVAKRPKDEERTRKDAEKEVARLEKECERRVARLTREASVEREDFENERNKEEEERIERERNKMEKLQWLVFRRL